MAGEWIPLDCNLGTKPEVLELVDETGLPVEVVCWRLVQLWSWAALNSSDGTIKATPRRVASVAGGDEEFWLAVERVGWVTFVGDRIVIEGWEKRFSGSAKARALHARRQDSYRGRPRDAAPSQGCDAPASHGGDASPSPQERTGEDRTGEEKTEIQPAAQVATSEPPKRRKRSQPADAVSWSADAGWQGITDADRQEWRLAYPACDLAAELAKAGSWLKANPTRAHKSNWRRFVVSWLTRSQDKGGTNRTPGVRPDERAPPQPQANRRFFRSDAQKSMTDAEHAAWRRDQRQGGMVAVLAGSVKLTDEVNQ
jgi:hypothetical protein